MLTLKRYQQRTLDALGEYLAKARLIGPKAAFERYVAQNPTDRLPQRYGHRWGMDTVPYVCLRLPTGGGKTILASHCIDLAAKTYLEREYPLVLWLTPTNIIRTQTAEALKKPFHPYREALDAAFGQDRVAVFDIADINNIRPKDLSDKVCVVVATMQTLRVSESNKEARKVYGHNENFEPHFQALPNAMPGLDRNGNGQVLYSFVNILHQLRPMVIVDEAHKAVSSLTGEMMQRINPACVIELTATPVESNILFRVYASELKDEQMVKLPFMLTEHKDWQQAINGAVQTRKRLAGQATGDADYIRPILLIQAESKDREHTVEVVKDHLIDNEGVAVSEIAIATGEQRELDGINLFDKTCPINYIITKEALKEGWDCSFAYVFCSVANIKSALDVEQLLGRVMRMPYARRRDNEELNRAYAHVISPKFAEAAEELHSRLVNMGFEAEEAAKYIQQQEPLPGMGDGELPLFQSPPPAPLTLTLEQPPDLAGLADEERETITLAENPDGTVTITAPVFSRDAEDLIVAANPKRETEIRRRVSMHRVRVRAAQPPSPARRGETFQVPQLSFELFGSRELLEHESLLVASNWSPINFSCEFLPGEFDYDEKARTFLFDLEGEKMSWSLASEQVQFTLLSAPPPSDASGLSRWLVSHGGVVDKSVPLPDMLEFCRRCVDSLLRREQFDLATIYRAKYALAAALKTKLEKNRQQAMQQGMALLFGEKFRLTTTLDFYPHVFPKSGYAENIAAYTGSYKFQKHYYGSQGVRDIKYKSEEFDCAREIDLHPKVKWWVRNLPSQDGSFKLPLANGHYFFPDFVAELVDGRCLVVEYKGEHLATGYDAQQKDNIGKLWEDRSAGKGLFRMLSKGDRLNI